MGVHTATGDISRADPACSSFLAAYRASAGGAEHLVNLRFHWARCVFHSLNGRIKAGQSTYDDGGNAEFRLFVAEFDRIVSRRAGE